MDKLILLDSNSIIHRAYNALPRLTSPSGINTGAIVGYMNILLKIIKDYEPTHIVAVFDKKAKTFRKEMYDDYKGKRKPMDPELAEQFDPLKRILKAMQIEILEKDGYEADDIIGTLSKKYSCQTFIVTADRDSLQLIDDSTTILLGVTTITHYDKARLLEDGFEPSQIIDLKALMGDTSDNIPGVKGIGIKTAQDLLSKYKTLDGVYENISEIKGKVQEKLIADKEMAYLSYKLATIDTQVPIECEFDKCKVRTIYSSEVKSILAELGCTKIINRMKFEETEDAATENICIDTEFEVIDKVDKLMSILPADNEFVLDINKKISMYCNGKAYEIVCCETILDFGIEYRQFLELLRPILNSNVKLIAYDIKTLMKVLSLHDIAIGCEYDDIMLKAYICDAPRSYKDVETLVAAYGYSDKNIAGALYSINKTLDKSMADKNLVDLYNNIELPLVKVLFDMEECGFKVNRKEMDRVSKEISFELNSLTEEIYKYAGGEFNINSTKQLANVLFEKLNLTANKKTKTGYSTNVEVLTELRREHPIIEKILRYREISKLQSTYLVGMKDLIDKDSKIHTVFKQAVTATGRLSSTEPNLQNIPIRKPEGAKIRSMFIPSDNNKLIVADYSQIELRLMAHLSGDDAMRDAFNKDIDIHTLTAAKANNVSIDNVTTEMRRNAKAVNFGIIYGISDFGLANDLGVPVYMAKAFIEKFFESYPKVKQYMDNCVETAKKQGYVTTILGRRRDIIELKSSKFSERSFGERIAMNMPMQGSASDIVKLAMIRVYNALNEGGFKAKMIMQVHDELLIDCPVDEVERVKVMIKQIMENAVELSVKLNVNVGVGDNWLEAK